MPTTFPTAIPFDPAVADAASGIGLETADGIPHSGILIVATAEARASGWAARSAIALVDRIARTAKVLLIDLTTNGGELDEYVGAESLEGIADIFLFGASLRHVIQHLPEHGFDFVPAGESADPESLLNDARWGRLLTEARGAYQVLLFYLPADAPGLDRLAGRVHPFIALTTPEEIENLQNTLPDYATCVAVLQPPRQAEVVPERPAPAPRSEEDFEAIRVPRNAAREALIADLRTRQRAARMMEAPPLEPIERMESREPTQTRAKPATPASPMTQRAKAPPPLTEPPMAGVQRKRPVKSRRALYIALSLAVLAAFAAGTVMVLQRYRAVTVAQDPNTAATPPAGQGTVVPLPFSVAVEAHQQLADANERVNSLREDEPEIGFYIAPLLLDSVIYYRVMAGPVADSAAAANLLERLLARGYKTGSTPYDVRATPLAFLLGEYDRRSEAEDRERVAADLLIPSYVVEVPQPDGSVKYRVYAGAYTGLAEAEVLGQLLRTAGLPDSLVQRVGRNPS